jgi:hypothetical protein
LPGVVQVGFAIIVVATGPYGNICAQSNGLLSLRIKAVIAPWALFNHTFLTKAPFAILAVCRIPAAIISITNSTEILPRLTQT